MNFSYTIPPSLGSIHVISEIQQQQQNPSFSMFMRIQPIHKMRKLGGVTFPLGAFPPPPQQQQQQQHFLVFLTIEPFHKMRKLTGVYLAIPSG